jgi:hypothetical protein
MDVDEVKLYNVKLCVSFFKMTKKWHFDICLLVIKTFQVVEKYFYFIRVEYIETFHIDNY